MDNMEYNHGEHQQRVLKITKGEYTISFNRIRPVGDKCCEKMLCERKKFFNYAGEYVQ
jgi:hypothetical protein